MRLPPISWLALHAGRRAVAAPALALLPGPAAAAARAAGGFESWAPLGAYERTGLREASSFRATLPTRDGDVEVAFHPVAAHARSYHAESVDARGVRRGIARPELTTWTGAVAPDSGRRDFAKLAQLPGGRLSGLLRVDGVL